MLVYTCPECGKELQFSVIATYPPINVAECPSCGWREEKRDTIEKIPYKTTTVTSDVYTKEEVITILEEIQMEIKKLPVNVINSKGLLLHMEIAPSAEDAYILIQQKINSLKEVKDGSN